MRLVVENLVFSYGYGGLGDVAAVDNVSLCVEPGEFIGIIGQTDLVRVLPTFEGVIKACFRTNLFDGCDICQKGRTMLVRQKGVGVPVSRGSVL